MPRFYFDLVLGMDYLRDDDGHELGSLQAAERDAMHTAGEIARSRLQNGSPEDIRVEVKDEHRQQVLAVTVSIRVDRIEPSHT
ncbi:hypothetical protein KBI52_11385 [Microvirga sp. HBU67558]|uniref:DUF6894 family protein n=1 Tax=Microvirga TaxID=186650 RepID=UPI001B373981|nr:MULTISPECIES: hypothetical protein [unclassified Microvirga]MBQ0820808.1 hypothetical protein [Microvirga sp. HBU67558]